MPGFDDFRIAIQNTYVPDKDSQDDVAYADLKICGMQVKPMFEFTTYINPDDAKGCKSMTVKKDKSAGNLGKTGVVLSHIQWDGSPGSKLGLYGNMCFDSAAILGQRVASGDWGEAKIELELSIYSFDPDQKGWYRSAYLAKTAKSVLAKDAGGKADIGIRPREKVNYGGVKFQMVPFNMGIEPPTGGADFKMPNPKNKSFALPWGVK